MNLKYAVKDNTFGVNHFSLYLFIILIRSLSIFYQSISSRIVFISLRDSEHANGQVQIYSMNLDGINQVRLTYKSF